MLASEREEIQPENNGEINNGQRRENTSKNFTHVADLASNKQIKVQCFFGGGGKAEAIDSNGGRGATPRQGEERAPAIRTLWKYKTIDSKRGQKRTRDFLHTGESYKEKSGGGILSIYTTTSIPKGRERMGGVLGCSTRAHDRDMPRPVERFHDLDDPIFQEIF